MSSPYDETIEAIRHTWGSQPVPGLDIYYVYGNPHDDAGRAVLSRYVGGRAPVIEDDAIRHIGDVLIVGCADHIDVQKECLLHKRLRAYAFLSAGDRYDLIYTVCATSYVDQPRLAVYAASLASGPLVAGAIGIDKSSTPPAPFVSGASMILSVEIARELGVHRREIIAGNAFGHHDDVTVGQWIATRMSGVPLAAFIEDIEAQQPMTAAHIFVSCPMGTIDYVMTPAPEQRPVRHAFHYHFHSQKAGDIVQFHQRYYAS